MDDRFGRSYRGLPQAVRSGLGGLCFGGFCVGGWFVGRRFWHDPTPGVFAGLGVASLVYGAAYTKTRAIIVDSIMVFFLGVPLIYSLVLITQIPLLVLGLVPFNAHAYFVTPILGATVGTGMCTLYNLKGTLSKASESTTDQRFDMQRWFFDGVSYRTAIAFVLAALFVVPATKPAALITLGVAWGAVAAAVQIIFIVLFDHESVREGWLRIVMVEVLLAVCVWLGLAFGISNHPVVGQTLELGLPAALTVAVTYGLVYLIATVGTLLRATATAAASRSVERRTSSVDDVS
ncbi:MAG TPA: hypothetical protein VIV12_21330 [Streptosporangiaceae bacterium]